MAMNSSGLTRPRSGCSQRTSASRPTTWPSKRDLGLVVQLHVAGVEGAAQVAEQAEPVGGVAVPRRPRRPRRRCGRAWPGTSRRRRGAAAPRRPARGRGRPRPRRWPPGPAVSPSRLSGEPRAATRSRATRWARVGESQAGSRTANSSPPSRAASAPRGRASRSRSAICSSSRSPARWPRVSLTERNRSRSIRTSAAPLAVALGDVQRGPGALQQPLPVGQPGERVAQLLLGAGPGDPQRGVQGDQRHREQRQQRGRGRRRRPRSAARCRAVRRRPALPEQGGAGHGGQSAAARGDGRTTAGCGWRRGSTARRRAARRMSAYPQEAGCQGCSTERVRCRTGRGRRRRPRCRGCRPRRAAVPGASGAAGPRRPAPRRPG